MKSSFRIIKNVPDPVPGYVFRWAMDNASGPTTPDSSGGGRTGTLLNFADPLGLDPTTYPLPQRVSGRVGPYALSFDGVNQIVQHMASSPLTSGITHSLSAWINAASLPGAGCDILNISAGNSTPSAFNILYLDATGHLGHYSESLAGSNRVSTATAASLDAWYHVGVGVKSDRVELYIGGLAVSMNGAPEATVTGSMSTTTHVSVGAGYHNGDTSVLHGPFHGKIDEVRAYSRFLTPEEWALLAAM